MYKQTYSSEANYKVSTSRMIIIIIVISQKMIIIIVTAVETSNLT
jgi:hypothetical protein